MVCQAEEVGKDSSSQQERELEMKNDLKVARAVIMTGTLWGIAIYVIGDISAVANHVCYGYVDTVLDLLMFSIIVWSGYLLGKISND